MVSTTMVQPNRISFDNSFFDRSMTFEFMLVGLAS